jgi:acyl dehydratase
MPDSVLGASLVGAELPEVTTILEPAAVVAYVRAVGETNPAYPQEEAGAEGKLVPPTFAAVYAMSPPSQMEGESAVRIKPQRLVHGEQAFEWRRALRVGETITTSARVADVYQKRSLQFVVIEGTARDSGGETVAVSRTTVLVLPDPEVEA